MRKSLESQKSAGFRKTILSNGVRLISEEIPSVRSVSVGIWVFTGSRDETEAESGISHFIEHMVFKGTARRSMSQIARRMEAVGGYLNAFTGKEYTCFYARALDEHLARAIDTVSDLVLTPSFPEREIVKEKDVVVEEMKMYEDSPEDIIFDHFEGVIYGGHPMGRPIIGTEETVRSFTAEQLHSFVESHYTPDNMVLAMAGNLDHDRAVRLAEKAFQSTPRPPKPRFRSPVEHYRATDLVKHKSMQQAHLVLGRQALHLHHPRRVTLSVLNTILGGGMSSRLSQNIREKHGYCYSVYSFMNLHSDTGDFGIYMGTDASKIDHARKLIFRELDKLIQRPISQQGLRQAKAQVKGAIMLGLENMGNRMMRIGRQELYFERNYTLDEILAEVDAVTVGEIQELAAALFAPDQFSSVVMLPEG